VWGSVKRQTVRGAPQETGASEPAAGTYNQNGSRYAAGCVCAVCVVCVCTRAHHARTPMQKEVERRCQRSVPGCPRSARRGGAYASGTMRVGVCACYEICCPLERHCVSLPVLASMSEFITPERRRQAGMVG